MESVIVGNRLDAFTQAYIECALWTSRDGDLPTNLEREGYTVGDLAPETLASIQEDCRCFHTDNTELLYLSGLTDRQAGHDFWLTRNRHGAGFWDRGNDSVFRELTDAAHTWGSSDLYVGDDGKVYVM